MINDELNVDDKYITNEMNHPSQVNFLNFFSIKYDTELGK